MVAALAPSSGYLLFWPGNTDWFIGEAALMLERESFCPHIGGLQGQEGGGACLCRRGAKQGIGGPREAGRVGVSFRAGVAGTAFLQLLLLTGLCYPGIPI